MMKSMLAMKSVFVFLLATWMVIPPPLMISAQIIPTDPESVARWYRNLPYATQTVTRLHFFFQDVVSGDNPTAVEVARANSTGPPTFFGLVRVFDDPLTVNCNPASTVVGYGQGLYALTSKQDLSLLFAFTFAFTEGIYNGSTLSILGRNPMSETYRELPIVGGSGYFRLATGSAIAHTYWNNATTQDGIVEFWVTAVHYLEGYVGSKEEGSVKEM